jgi:hypothetical protein
MTETTQPDPRVARVYPDGWNLGYCVSGSESDGTACVPIAVDRDAVAEDAETAERATGARMEVFHDGEHWCYRPALTPARKPLTVADIPAGQGPASLFIGPGRYGEHAVMYRTGLDYDHVFMTEGPDDPSEARRAMWDHLAATLPHVTTEETH